MANKPNAVMSHSDFMNELDWDEKIDNFFIDFLANQCRMGYHVYGKSNISPVPLAIDAIRNKFGLDFSLKHCMKKLASLEERYNVFTWMLSLEGVVHILETNKVYAPDSVWAYMLKTQSCLFAYRTHGESKLYQLTEMFGPSKFIKGKEVIQISSGVNEGNDGLTRQNANEIIVIDDDTASAEWVRAPPSKGKGKEKRIYLRQTCMWDYVADEPDNSLCSQFSMANTNMKSIDVRLNEPRKKPLKHGVVKTKGKMVTDSCASNDPGGNRFEHPDNV